MREFIGGIIAIFAIIGIVTGVQIMSKKRMQEVCEYAYFMGQYDAINNRVKIDSSSLQWTESPWLDKTIPIFEYGTSKLGKEAKKQISIGIY